MRAALFGGPRSITVGERPDPVISAPTDAMVRGNHHLLFSHWCARPHRGVARSASPQKRSAPAIRPTGSAEKYYTHIIRQCIVAPLE